MVLLKCDTNSYELMTVEAFGYKSCTHRLFLNEVHTGVQPVLAWFLEIVLVCMLACVSVSLFPIALITSGMIWCDIDLV